MIANNAKRWDHVTEADIGEVECTEARNANLPGTDLGQQTLDEREKKK